MTSVRTHEIMEAVSSIFHHACSTSMIDLSADCRMITHEAVVQAQGRFVVSAIIDTIGMSLVFLVARDILFFICSRIRFRFVLENILTPVEN